MKNKHLRNTLISIASIIGLTFATIGVLVTDFTNNTPTYISEVEGMSPGDFMGAKVEQSLGDCGPFDDFEFLFNEHEINDLLATVTPLIKLPMVNIKSIYLKINDDNSINAEAPAWAACFRTCAKVDGYLSYDESVVTLRLTKIKANLLTSKWGAIDWALSDKNIQKIENALLNAGVHLNMCKDNKDIIATMTNLDICKTIADCSKTASGFLTSAIVAGAISARNVEFKINENGLTGVIIHRSLLY